MQIKLAYRGEKISSETDFDLNIQQATAKLNSFIYKIPCFSKISSWEKWFRERALRYSLEMDSIFSEKNQKIGDFVNSNLYTLTLRGDFLNIGEYLESIENDECLCAIDGLEMETIASKPGSVQARVDIAVLNSPTAYDSEDSQEKNPHGKESKKFYYNSVWDTNPFIKQAHMSIEKEKRVQTPKKRIEKRTMGIDDIRLNGIIFYNNEYSALINDERFHEGDHLLGYEIYRIEKENVYLTCGEERYRLTMHGNEKKKKLK
ncbi:MAG: hypothetical protein ACMUIP_03410 [bacterium]